MKINCFFCVFNNNSYIVQVLVYVKLRGGHFYVYGKNDDDDNIEKTSNLFTCGKHTNMMNEKTVEHHSYQL